ncbi:tRNA N6-adenosine threonylcarbamoyltransferase [Candidatus Tremblaya princeps]|uniref:tRNA N6-adenosine threonylcarbamoyltransferase n=1 Tax=Tremblaya princeps TaxID=189385 RepID=A0A143WNS9_TREPR|nr:tRNA N6-adenosine threonylcarbamoyltransferase [Candidatus Tremblaya princeps]
MHKCFKLLTLGVVSSFDVACMAVYCSQLVSSSSSHHGAMPLRHCCVVPELAAQSHLHQANSRLTTAVCFSVLVLATRTSAACTVSPGLGAAVEVGLSLALSSLVNRRCSAVAHTSAHVAAIGWAMAAIVASGYTTRVIGGIGAQCGRATLLPQLDDAMGECIDKAARAIKPNLAMHSSLAYMAEAA